MVSGRTIQVLTKMLLVGQIAATVAVLLVAGKLLGRIRGNEIPPSSINATLSPEPADSNSTRANLKPLEWYRPIWERDLRQPPIPPVITATSTPVLKPKRPPLPTLLGTFIEGERSWAHLVTPSGTRRVLQLREQVADFVLVTVEPRRAELRYGGQLYWIEMPRAEPVIREQQ